MLTCQELSRLVASDEVMELSFWLRLQARLHALLCRHCRHYREQIEALGPAARRAWASLPADAPGVEALERRILERAGRPRGEAEADPDAVDEPGPED